LTRKFHISIDENDFSDLVNLLENQNNISNYIAETLEKVRTGELIEPDLSDVKKQTMLEYLELRNEKLQLDIELKKKQLGYTPETKKVITSNNQKLETRVLPEKNEKTVLPIEDINPAQYLVYLRNTNNEWNLKCKFCGNTFSHSSRDESLSEYARHLKAIHEEEIKKSMGLD